MPTQSFIYSIPYLLVLLCFLILQGITKQNTSNNVSIQRKCILLFLLFLGLRGFIGWDWTGYYQQFMDLQPFSGNYLQNYDMINDVGYVTYATIIRTFTQNYHVFVFISVLIDVLVLDWFIKKYSPAYAFSFAVFMAISLSAEIDLLRNMKSLLFFLMAIPYLEKRNAVKYFSLIFIAILFHASAVAYLPLYFFLHKKMPRAIFMSLLIVGNIIYILQIPVLSPVTGLIDRWFIGSGGRFGDMAGYIYSETYSQATGFSLTYFEKLITSIIFVIYYDKITDQRKSNIIFMNLYIIYSVIILYCSEISIIVFRVGNLFAFSYWILWPATAKCIVNRNNRKLYLALIISFMILYTGIKTNNILFKYDNVLCGARSYNDRFNTFVANKDKLL